MRIFLLTAGLFAGLLFSTSGAEQSSITKVNNNVATNNQGISVDPDFQQMMDSWPKGVATNGLICAIQIFRPAGAKELLPLCCVNVINTTTNWIKGYLDIPLQGLVEMELFDPLGNQVEKTAVGKGYDVWTDEQIERWINGRPRGGTAFRVSPLLYCKTNGRISFPEAFTLKKSGEYTLHLRMRLVQGDEDSLGQIHLQRIWLPEVVAKVQIRPEDIPLPDLPPNAQTNSLTK